VISLTDAKRQLRLEPEQDQEDALILDMIDAATRYVERRIGWRLGEPEEVILYLCGDGSRGLYLPQPVESATVEGVEDFDIRGHTLVRADGWQAGEEYEVTVTLGFAVDEGPPDLRQAVRLIVAGWFEHREAWVMATVTEHHKHSVKQILGPYQTVRA
jgi:hypothetical protein